MKANIAAPDGSGAAPLPRRMRIAGVADGIGLARLWLRLRAQGWWPWPELTVLMYHRINHAGAAGALDPELIDADPEAFEAQLRFFAAYFSCVTTEDVLGAMDGGPPLPPNPLMITFDDGYLDNFQHALPVLQRTGMRAVFFVCTDFMQQQRIFWWDRIVLTVGRATREHATLAYPDTLVLDLSTGAGRRAAIARAIATVKNTFALDVERFLAELAQACGAHFPADEERALARTTVMGWPEVLALREAGMDVQSHTRSHRVLGTLPQGELTAELVGAREELEQRLKKPVRAIAYPVGRSILREPHLRAAMVAAGYRMGFTAVSGRNQLDVTDAFDMRRLMMDRCLPAGVVRGLSALPWLAAPLE